MPYIKRIGVIRPTVLGIYGGRAGEGRGRRREYKWRVNLSADLPQSVDTFARFIHCQFELRGSFFYRIRNETAWEFDSTKNSFHYQCLITNQRTLLIISRARLTTFDYDNVLIYFQWFVPWRRSKPVGPSVTFQIAHINRGFSPHSHI